MLSLGTGAGEKKVYPLDLPKVIQSICPPAQHILALRQLGHQVFEVVLGFCQGPLVGEVTGGTIGVPSPWVQSSTLHWFPLFLEEKENRLFTPRFSDRRRKGTTMYVMCGMCQMLLLPHWIFMTILQGRHYSSHFSGRKTGLWQGKVAGPWLIIR